MPILDMQRRLHEVGRIRIGRQVATSNGRSRPEKLEHFRFTSAAVRPLEAVAALYGGEVHEWEGAPVGEQYELYTNASELDVALPPTAMAFTQWYELWSAGGCQRRCDGVEETISGQPCCCDAEARECKPHTRLSVMLKGVPTLGLWRLDTGGIYAAQELMGASDFARFLTEQTGRSILPARLRVVARTTKRPDPKKPDKTITRNFVVPVLDFDVDIAAIAPGVEPRPLALPAPAPAPGLTPIPAKDGPSLEEQLKAVETPAPKPPRRNAAAPLPATKRRPRTQSERAASEDAWAGMDVLPQEPAAPPPPVQPPPAPSPPPVPQGEGPAVQAPSAGSDATDPAPSSPPTDTRDIVRLRNDVYRVKDLAIKKDPQRAVEVARGHGYVSGSSATWIDHLKRDELLAVERDWQQLLTPPPEAQQQEFPT